MYIGTGIVLLVIGAVLAFAVQDQTVGGVDLEVIGWICMGGGALAIVLSFVVQQQRARNSRVEAAERRDLNGPPGY